MKDLGFCMAGSEEARVFELVESINMRPYGVRVGARILSSNATLPRTPSPSLLGTQIRHLLAEMRLRQRTISIVQRDLSIYWCLRLRRLGIL